MLPDDISKLIDLRKQVVERLDEIEKSEHEKVKGTIFEGQSRYTALKQTGDLLTDINTKLSDLGAIWDQEKGQFTEPKPTPTPHQQANK